MTTSQSGGDLSDSRRRKEGDDFVLVAPRRVATAPLPERGGGERRDETGGEGVFRGYVGRMGGEGYGKGYRDGHGDAYGGGGGQYGSRDGGAYQSTGGGYDVYDDEQGLARDRLGRLVSRAPQGRDEEERRGGVKERDRGRERGWY